MDAFCRIPHALNLRCIIIFNAEKLFLRDYVIDQIPIHIQNLFNNQSDEFVKLIVAKTGLETL